MATTGSSNDTRNFQCVTVASVDVIKLPLSDILASHIKPVDLYHKIKSLSTLKLRSDQQKICFIPPPGVPDYNKFDVTLLYTLIRNLCSLPSPAQGWGKEPKPTDTQISDDIERLRLFRNNYYAHAESAVISDAVFKDVWKNLKLVFRRIQPKTGCSVDYEAELIKIERTTFTDDYLTTLRVILEALVKLEKQTDGRDDPDIFIEGENEIICGGTAQIEAEVRNVKSSFWSITWQKRRGNVINCIDTNMEKYSGSSKKKLIIKSICKEDEGEYQAVLSLESNGPEYKSRNIIRLHATGEKPFLNISNAVSGLEGITIHYNCGVLKHSPEVHHIEWSKDGQPLHLNAKKYVGGGVRDSHFTIMSPTNEDEGNYSCKVTNAVGFLSKSVNLGVPNVKPLEEDLTVCFGSKTTIKFVISSTPTLTKLRWQKSKYKEKDYQNIGEEKDFESDTCSSLVIHRATFADKLYYRLHVQNGIGETFSKPVYLKVTGSPPSIKIIPETNIKNRSVKLTGNLIIYVDSPGIQDFFWTRNDEPIKLEEFDGKLSETRTDNPSLNITNVSPDDAGEYQLTAINAVGSCTSEAIVLGAPCVSEEKNENEQNGGQLITVTINSIPAPCHVQWSAKGKEEDTFKPIDINAEEYKGTTVTLPYPVLFVRQKNQLENICFRIEVTNFIGKTGQDIFANATTGQRKIDTVENTIYNDDGEIFKFTMLSSTLVKHFPSEKLDKLKFLIKNSRKVRNLTSVKEANSVLECIEILQDEQLFTQKDVIYMQFLCQEVECFDLFTKCIEYAETQKALCYFKKPLVNGFQNVDFHVQGDVSGYTRAYINHVIKTVVVMLGCKDEDILLNGVRHSKSFLLSLSVKEICIWKLLALNEKDRIKLIRHNIDYLIIDGEIIRLERPTEYGLNMDSECSFQNMILCHYCDAVSPPVRCTICKIRLCTTCIGKHLSNEFKNHIVVPVSLRRGARCSSKCLKHTSAYCEFYCMECDIPVCVHCVSAIGHRGHKFIEMAEKIEIQKDILQRDLQELEKWIYPKYQEIASKIPIQKSDLNENSKKLTANIDKHGEDLHRVVDNIISKLKSDAYEQDSRCLSAINKQEDEITRTISEITESIAYMKKLLYSNDVSLVSGYKSRNAEFRMFPPKLTISLPMFTPQEINEKQIYQQFGSLSESLIKTEKHGSKKNSPRAEYSTAERALIDEPQIITEINAGNVCGLHSISVANDEHIWTCGYKENIMKLYNLQGILVDSIKTKSGDWPSDIAVRFGNLVYTDYNDKTVNIVEHTQIKTVITLQEWSPLGVCCTSTADLMVVLVNSDFKQTKIVRYSGSSEKQTIKYTDKGRPLFSSGSLIEYISENSNLDICVADNGAGAVVVVNKFGKLRFNYTGPRPLFTTEKSFDPVGITTDSKSRILIADQNNQRIHILDKNGQFLRYIDNCHLQRPRSLSVDTRDNLFVAEFSTNKVKKIQYCI